jgi:hypothetical protein
VNSFVAVSVTVKNFDLISITNFFLCLHVLRTLFASYFSWFHFNTGGGWVAV